MSAPESPERPLAGPLRPLAAQLDMDGGAHEIAPAHERMRLFEPAPTELEGQQWLELDTEAGS